VVHAVREEHSTEERQAECLASLEYFVSMLGESRQVYSVLYLTYEL